jgi:CheY-like chemotaxis protein
MRSNPTVLLVRRDDEARDLMASWLEAEGFDVMTCPGPAGPGYVCVGERTGRCPLAEAADVVAIDARLESGEVPDGTSPYDLMALYRSLGLPVLVMGGDDQVRVLLHDDEGVVFLGDRADECGQSTGGLIRSVERLVG